MTNEMAELALAHLSIASKNFSCSSSLHLSRGFVILYGLRDLQDPSDRILDWTVADVVNRSSSVVEKGCE